MNEARFSTNFNFYDADGVKYQQTVRSNDAETAHVQQLKMVTSLLTSEGYLLKAAGTGGELHDGEETELVEGYLVARKLDRDGKTVHLLFMYGSERLKWALAMIYSDNQLWNTVPFEIDMSNVFPSSSPPVRTEAGEFFHTLDPPVEIVRKKVRRKVKDKESGEMVEREVKDFERFSNPRTGPPKELTVQEKAIEYFENPNRDLSSGDFMTAALKISERRAECEDFSLVQAAIRKRIAILSNTETPVSLVPVIKVLKDSLGDHYADVATAFNITD